MPASEVPDDPFSIDPWKLAALCAIALRHLEREGEIERARDAALEEAIRIAETPEAWKPFEGDFEGNCIAAAIRALKSKASP